MMTKKDYEDVADAVRFVPIEQREPLVKRLVLVFGERNVDFRPDLFTARCGLAVTRSRRERLTTIAEWIDGTQQGAS